MKKIEHSKYSLLPVVFFLLANFILLYGGDISAEEQTPGERLHQHIANLSAAEFQGRGIDTEGIRKAGDYIAAIFSQLKLRPFGGQVGYVQSWRQLVPSLGKKIDMENIVAMTVLEKEKSLLSSDGFIIICAHYDHLGIIKKMKKEETAVSYYPGADDNASGIAVLLELAKIAAENPDALNIPIVFAAFSGEEAGCFGSKYFIGDIPPRYKEKIIGVINLDTIGRLRDNKLYVMGWQSSPDWEKLFEATATSGQIEYSFIPHDLDSSDQTSFIKESIPAIQLFTGPHQDYHQLTDTADKINNEGLVSITDFVWEIVKKLSERSKPLTFTESIQPKQHTDNMNATRQVSTGITPDFTWSGKGVKILEIRENTAAQKAGLQKGDIITQLDQIPINGLKEYAAILKEYKPGQNCQITFSRSEKIERVILQFDEKK